MLAKRQRVVFREAQRAAEDDVSELVEVITLQTMRYMRTRGAELSAA